MQIDNVVSQTDFYNTKSIQEIRIQFEQLDWDRILDSLYIDGQEERLLAQIEINGEAFDSVGIRYKGFSSVSVDRKKNPFNIKLDYIKNQNYQGIEKIKLSNVIQDPSFLREVLSYQIARSYMPSSKSNFAKVFVNDEYLGLYTNVESVNNKFLTSHYHSSNGTFVKCNPENVDLTGENCNLNNSPGSDSSNYYSLYDLKSDFGWVDLFDLITTLNTRPEDIEKIINIDRTLWMHAFNYALVNFDSYVGYAQNYYLYQDKFGVFQPIIWDLNMSFASFRFTDASEHFDGFTIREAKIIDPLLHYSSVSVIPRPLMREIFNNDLFRKMYIAHIRTIIEEYFVSNDYYEIARRLQSLIDEDVKNDVNKFYTYEDFILNIDTTTSDLIDYPGIRDLMSSRTSYLANYQGYQNAPDLMTESGIIDRNRTLFLVETINAELVYLYYRNEIDAPFSQVEMVDDGTAGDGAPGDGIYGYIVDSILDKGQYYFFAENELSGRFHPERAAYEYFSIINNETFDGLVINEFMASNESIISDEAGEFEDWIELYNNGNINISLYGLYLSDDGSVKNKWPFPNINLEPDEYLIIWADNDENDGELHSNFKLSSSGESIYLTSNDGSVIDSVIFSEKEVNESFSRIPNGIGPFQTSVPTPGRINYTTGTFDDKEIHIVVYPNPTTGSIRIDHLNGIDEIVIMNSIGEEILMRTIPDDLPHYDMMLEGYPKGVYLLKCQLEKRTFELPFVKL